MKNGLFMRSIAVILALLAPSAFFCDAPPVDINQEQRVSGAGNPEQRAAAARMQARRDAVEARDHELREAAARDREQRAAVREIRAIVEARNLEPRAVARDRNQELSDAVIANDVAEITILLRDYGEGIDLTIKDPEFGQTVLHDAVMFVNQDIDQDRSILNRLLVVDRQKWQQTQIGAIDIQDTQGNTPLHLAAGLPGNVGCTIYQLLLDYGASQTVGNRGGQTPGALVQQHVHPVGGAA